MQETIQPTPNLGPPLAASLVAVMVAWGIANVSDSNDDTMDVAAGGGPCLQMCEIAACVAFSLSSQQESCEVLVKGHLHDLNRAGPDPRCIAQCAAGYLPAAFAPSPQGPSTLVRR